MKTLYKQVEQILEQFPESRNSDKKLTILLWSQFYGELTLLRKSDGKNYIALDRIMLLPSQDGIKRYRAVIQNNEGRFLPTRYIAKRRWASEQEWREEMGHTHTTNERI